MRRIFTVELSAEHEPGRSLCTELTLPAQPWALYDALDKLQTGDGAGITTEICQYYAHEHLAPIIQDSPDLYELNALALRLAALNQGQSTAFEGLVKMKAGGRQESLSTKKLLDPAASVDCCHVVPEALTDAQLGRFYAENGFVTEVDDLSDEAFGLLNFDQIGYEARIREGGVFTQQGYVVQHDELKTAPSVPVGKPLRPLYTMRLMVDNFFCKEYNPQPLDLPATQEELQATLDKLSVSSWGQVIIDDYDGAVPDLLGIVDRIDGIDHLNKLADMVKYVLYKGELPKFKAILEATKCTDLDDMIDLAGQLNQYVFEANHQSFEDIALSDLRVIAGEPALELLVPHVNLNGYGQAVAEKMNLTLSSYGAVSRSDGEPIQTFDSDGPQQGGMEVTM